MKGKQKPTQNVKEKKSLKAKGHQRRKKKNHRKLQELIKMYTFKKSHVTTTEYQ